MKNVSFRLTPIHLLKGGSVVFVIDPEHVLEVFLQPSAVKSCHQSCGIMKGWTLADLHAEAGFLQVPLVVEHLVLTRREDCPPDMAAAHSPSPACLWGD